MKKFLTKIIGASLAIAMMIGVGAGVNANKVAKPVHATTYEWQKMTSKSEFANGAVILVTQDAYYLDASQAATGNTPRMASLTLSNNLPTLTADATKCLTVSNYGNEGLRMYGPGGTNYLYTNTSNNGTRIGTSSTAGSIWTIEDAPTSGQFYLKSNASTARYLSRFFVDDIKNTDLSVLTDAKTRLQEEMQAEHRDSVRYVLIKEEGPAHDRTFEVNVMFNDIVLGTGEGKSKKEAQEAAAKDALDKRSVL